MLACRPLLGLDWALVAILPLAFMAADLAISRLLYHLGVDHHPWACRGHRAGEGRVRFVTGPAGCYLHWPRCEHRRPRSAARTESLRPPPPPPPPPGRGRGQRRPDEVARARGQRPEEIFPPALLAAYRSAELMRTEAGK